MNLTAKTGASACSGAAFLILGECKYTAGASGHQLRTRLNYHAYAPDPIVGETMRKGTWVGRGAS